MESIQVMKGLWTEDSFTFEGEFFRFPPTLCGPRPQTQPHPPIWLGGFSDKVLRRIAEHCQGWLPVYQNDRSVFGGTEHGPTNAREARDKLHRFAEEAGRTVEHFEIAAIMTPDSDIDAIWQYRDAGVDRIAVTLPEVETIDEARLALESMARTLKLN
jgi:alkanesulfonate monooxygenase SsuD/methylene tetrahydromethanopterin reductase-like flavin-dependent oxidoreductase (luciferase family)